MNSSSGNSTAGKTNQNVQVYLRIRPTNTREKLIRSMQVVESLSHREVQVKPTMAPESRSAKTFTFDRVFGTDSQQYEVYQTVVAPYIEEVLSGYNCTVFAYGQTGTGKTHTMVGEEEPVLSAGWDDQTETGIIPRAVCHLFDELRLKEMEFSIRVSYLELYNEELCDLLSTDDTVKIRIYDDANKKGSVVIHGLEEITVHSKDDVYKLLAKGQERRKTASTLMNAQSSRSHTIFTIIVHIKESGIDGEEMVKIGKINLVDLAGSENMSKAGNEKGIRIREAANINQSLLTLGRVITALVDRRPHIPYRESKLTRLLQESLGGRTKTSIIATVSPGHKDFEESLSTIEYAHRAKNIQNKPEANQRLLKKALIKEYNEEIDRLKRELVAARDKNGIYLPEETYNELLYKTEATTKELNDKVALLKFLKEDLARKEALFKELSINLNEREETLRETEEKLCETRHDLTRTKRSLNKTKQRYVEKKVILETHMKTEEALTSQARELIEVVENVTNDTHGLHEMVDRRRETDNRNKTVTEQFVYDMRDQIQKMQRNVTTLVGNSTGITSGMSTQCGKYRTESIALNEQLLRQLSGLETNTQELLQQNATRVAQMLETEQQWTTSQLDTFTSFVQNVNKSITDTMITINATVASLKQTLTNNRQLQDEERRQLLAAFQQSCQANDERNVAFCQSQSEALGKLGTFLGYFEQTQADVDHYVSNANKANETSLKDIDQMRAQFNAFLDSMTAGITQNSNDLQRLQKASTDMATNRTTIETELRSTAQAVVSATEQNQEALTKLTTNAEQMAELETTQCQALEDLLAKMDISEVEALTANGRTLCDTQTEHLKTFHVAYQLQQHQLATTMATQRTTLETAHRDQTTAIESAIENLQDVHQQFSNSVASFAQQSQSNVDAYHTEITSDFDQLTNRVERFHQDELTVYQPTGQTPARKTVSYPKNIAMTSPHDRIVRRFWRERGTTDLNNSTTIIEDQEDVSLLQPNYHCDEMRNSTPLRDTSRIMDDERNCFKEMHLSNVVSKIGNDVEDCEENKENVITIIDNTMEDS